MVHPTAGIEGRRSRSSRQRAGVYRYAHLLAHQRLPEEVVLRHRRARAQRADSWPRSKRPRSTSNWTSRAPSWSACRPTHSLAGVTSNRWQALLAKHAVSQQEADQTRANYIAAQAAVDASRANVRRLEQLQSYERIVAPFDGVITARNTDIGDLIDAGSGSTNPRELFHLDAIDKLRVYVAVPEVYSDSIHDGDSATLTQDSNPELKDSRHHRAQRQRHRPRPRAPSTSRWMSTTRRACCAREPTSSSTSICPRSGTRLRFLRTRCCSAPRAFASVSFAMTVSSLCRSPSATTSAVPSRSLPALRPPTKSSSIRPIRSPAALEVHPQDGDCARPVMIMRSASGARPLLLARGGTGPRALGLHGRAAIRAPRSSACAGVQRAAARELQVRRRMEARAAQRRTTEGRLVDAVQRSAAQHARSTDRSSQPDAETGGGEFSRRTRRRPLQPRV